MSEMRNEIKEDILAVLSQAISILETDEHPEHALSELSNHVIHDASIFQDDDSVSVAVLIYAFSKVVQHCCERNIEYRHLAKEIKIAYEFLYRNDYAGYRAAIKGLFEQIKTVDSKIKLYIQEVLDKARIKKGSKMHEHGISTARTAELLGITQWELQNYIGKQAEFEIKEMPAKKRLEIAREMFS